MKFTGLFPSPMKKRAKHRGFTLVELLIVLAVMPMILAMIHVVLVSTTDAVSFVEKQSASSRVPVALRNILRDDISACCLPPPRKPGSDNAKQTCRKLFLGEHADGGYDRLGFITMRPSRVAKGKAAVGLNEVSYEIRRNDADYRYLTLLRREEPLYDDNPTDGGTRAVLYDRVLAFDVYYFDGREWLREWDSSKENDLPAYVRVEMRIVSGSNDDSAESQIEILVPVVASKRKITKPETGGGT